MSNVLEHIEKRKELLETIKEIADVLLIRVPTLDRSWLALYKKEMNVEYRLDKTHFIEYTIDTFKREINSAGLEVLSYSIQFGEIRAKVGIS